MAVKVEIDNPTKIFNRIVTDAKRLEINNMVEKNMAPYVPRDTGALMSNTTVDDNGITYNENYAKINYEGTGRNFSREKNPLATAHWDKAMMTAKSGTVSREAERILKK
mgnify:CR=1 FL=1